MDLESLLNGDNEDEAKEEMVKFVEEQASMLMEASVRVVESQINAGYFDVIAKANKAYFDSLIMAGFAGKDALGIVTASAHTLMSHKS